MFFSLPVLATTRYLAKRQHMLNKLMLVAWWRSQINRYQQISTARFYDWFETMDCYGLLWTAMDCYGLGRQVSIEDGETYDLLMASNTQLVARHWENSTNRSTWKSPWVQMDWSEDCKDILEVQEVRREKMRSAEKTRSRRTPGTSGSQHHCRVHPIWSNSSWRQGLCLCSEHWAGLTQQAQHHHVKKCCGFA